MSELREAVARALCRLHIQQVARYDNPPPSEDRIQAGVDNCWEAHLERADAALAAIEAKGMVVVPKEPDDAFWSRVDFHDGRHSRSGETYPVQRNLHRAMIAAAGTEG